jgi:hypothetical protein
VIIKILLGPLKTGVVEYGSDGVMEKHPTLQYANAPQLQTPSNRAHHYFNQGPVMMKTYNLL